MMNEFGDSVFGLCSAIRILILLNRALVEFMTCLLLLTYSEVLPILAFMLFAGARIQ